MRKKTKDATSLETFLSERGAELAREIYARAAAETLERLRVQFVQGVAGALELPDTGPGGKPWRGGYPGKKKKPARALPKGAKRSPEALARLGVQFVAYVKKHPGQTIEEIAKVLRLRTLDLALPVRKALDAGEITKKGARRGTSYYPK